MTNTLAYCKKTVIYEQKKFYNIGPWWLMFETYGHKMFYRIGSRMATMYLNIPGKTKPWPDTRATGQNPEA